MPPGLPCDVLLVRPLHSTHNCLFICEDLAMPIYEYVCDDCGAHYERIVMSQKQSITCPKCESAKNTIQLSVFAAPANGSKASGGSSSGPASGSGGACCGGGCGCN